MSWRRLGVLVRQLPDEAGYVRAIRGPAGAWGATEHLLATIADRLAIGNWQRQGKEHAPRPKPLPRPGVEDETTKRFGTRSYTVETMRQILREWARRR